jgi:porin
MGFGVQLADAQSLSQLFTQPTLTGDWGGVRTNLENHGISFNLSYINQLASDFSGGERQGSDFAQQASVDAIIDLEKIAGLRGGTIDIGFDQRFGRSTVADFVGSKIPDQFVEGAGENFRVTSLSYTQIFDRGFITTEVGDYSMGNLYGNDKFFCNFESNAFCGHMTAQPNDSNGWSDYPVARWGGNITLKPTSNSYIQAGVFESNPSNATFPDGLKISLSGSTGVIIPVQLGVTTAFFGLPGHYNIGAYYDTSSIADVVIPEKIDTGRYGGYVIFDQMLISFSHDNERGLYVFGSYTHTDNRTTEIPQQIVGGFDIQGPLASRPRDFVDIGVSNISVNHRLIVAENATLADQDITDFQLEQGETDIEAGYGFQAAPWLLIHPNIQYIGNPGAFSFKHIPCAWVFGLDTRVVF